MFINTDCQRNIIIVKSRQIIRIIAEETMMLTV